MEAENDGPLWLRLSDFEERWAAAMPGVDTPSLDLLKVSGAGGGGYDFFCFIGLCSHVSASLYLSLWDLDAKSFVTEPSRPPAAFPHRTTPPPPPEFFFARGSL